MEETGFDCPECGSSCNHWIAFAMEIECDACGNVFKPDDED